MALSGGAEGEGVRLRNFGGAETFVVQVALVDGVEVHTHQQPDYRGSHPVFHFPECAEHQRPECQKNEYERAQRVGFHQRVAELFHYACYGRIVDGEHPDGLGRIAGLLKLIGEHVGQLRVAFGEGRPVDRREEPAGHAEERRQTERGIDFAAVARECPGLGEQFLQCKNGQQRDAEFGHYQNALDGPEFRVHRHIVDEQVGEPLHVAAQRKADRKHGSSPGGAHFKRARAQSGSPAGRA